jgi:molecular chaperone GrpE
MAVDSSDSHNDTAQAENTPVPPSAGENENLAEAHQAIAEAETEEESALALAEIQQKLEQAEAKAREYQEALLRQHAEQENMHKRLQRDVDNARKFALERFVAELLPVKDSLELGLEAAAKPEATVDTLREGSELILKMLGDALEKFGVQEINPVEQKFDPSYHEAMAMMPGDKPSGTVLIVHRKGYALNERLVRPAQVVVNQ